MGGGGEPQLSLTFAFLLSPLCCYRVPGIFCLSCILPFPSSPTVWCFYTVLVSFKLTFCALIPSPFPPGTQRARPWRADLSTAERHKDAAVSPEPPAADPHGRPCGWSLGETQAPLPPWRAPRRKSTRPGCPVAPSLQSRLRTRREWAETESKKDPVK